jgi:hypothetical protein
VENRGVYIEDTLQADFLSKSANLPVAGHLQVTTADSLTNNSERILYFVVEDVGLSHHATTRCG